MKIALTILAVLGGLVLVLVAIGYTLPVKHTVARERTLAAPPATVFAAISTPAKFPEWRSGVKSVELLPDVAGKPSFKEAGSDGTITYVADTIVAPHRLVTRIADKSLPFGGQWTHELIPRDSGTLIRITEDGEIYNPIFRVISRYMLGYHRTIDNYLMDLERHVTSGQSSAPR